MPLKYRDVIIEDDKTLADSGTDTIDINVTDPITELILRFTVKNESADVENVPPHMSISKIELVDGGQTYISLSGPQAIAAACFDTGKWPPSWYIEYPSSNQRDYIPLRFGRYLGDEQFGFDPRKMLNPQLKFTWTNSALHATGGTKLGVTARLMDGITSPPQMFCWKEIEAFTTVSGSIKSVDLPVDYPFRRLMIRSFEETSVPATTLTHFKMDCDVGKFIVFDMDVDEFTNVVTAEFGPYNLRMYCYGKNDDGRRIWMAHNTQVWGVMEDRNYFFNPWCSGGVNFTARMVHHDGTTLTTDKPFEAYATGWLPQHTWCYQFGRPNDPETWFPSSEYGEIKLKLTESVSDHAASVIVQQPRTIS